MRESTGLFDRLGNEIFVGDILEDEDRRFLKIVVNMGGNYELAYENGMRLGLVKIYIKYYQVKVVGNIYDNPDMLE